MKKIRLERINEVLDIVQQIGIVVNFGLYNNEHELYRTLPQYKNGVFYTEEDIINAYTFDYGMLCVHNTSDEGELVKQVFDNEFEDFISNEDSTRFYIKTYKTDLKKQLYEQQDQKLGILQGPNIQIA